MTPIENILPRLKGIEVEKPGAEWNACCPAHDDQRASLSIGVGDDGRVLLRCQANCETSAVVQALGLSMRDLFPKTNGHNHTNGSTNRHVKGETNGKSRGRIVSTYDYVDERGALLLQAVRFDPKGFSQRKPKDGGGWEWSVKDCRKVLYRLPELLKAEPGATVFVCEGEKDCDRLAGLGFIATTNVGGAGKWRDQYSDTLAGFDVVILPDNDRPGREHAEQVARSLKGKAVSIKVVELPGLPDKGDVSDWLAAGGTCDDLLRLVAQAPGWEPAKEQPSEPTPTSEGARPTDYCDRSDLGNSRRLVRLHSDKLRFCMPWDSWLVWDGMRWCIDLTGQAERLAKDVADSLWQEARDKEDSSLRQFASETASSGALSAMLKLARSEPGIPILPRELDTDPWLLNCINGTLDLRTGELRPHRREDFITKLCPTRFNPDAPSDQFDRFMDSIFMSQRLVDFMLRFLGHCLTGDVREQILVIFWGAGSNGKSTLLKAFMEMLGSDYAGKAVPELLLNKRNESHPTERADLFGKRFMACVETSEGRSLNESLVKELTGGDNVKARRLYEDFWEFVPTHKPVLCTNHKPQINGTDHAIWRRLALVPFAVKFWDGGKGETGPAELEVDKTLDGKLKAEHEGILASCVRGCLEWQRRGLALPAEVQAATAEYRKAEDKTEAFIAECCILSPMCKVKATPIYDAYRKWSEARGEAAMSQRRFGEGITERGFQKSTNNGVWYCGIGLVNDSDE